MALRVRSVWVVGLLAFFLSHPPGAGGGAALAASCVPAPAAFPLRLGPNARHLVDVHGRPFLINQASSWGLIQALSAADATDYLDALKQRGFNAVMVSIISSNLDIAGNPPGWQGVPPFTVPGDFSTFNEAYFAHADDIINRARERGMLVALVPSYLGYRTLPDKGWWDEMLDARNSREKCRAFGRFLGLRYRNAANLIWIAGGDNTPAAGSELEARLQAIVDGIRENDTTHPWTAHWDNQPTGVMATENPTFSSYINIEGYYAFDYDLTYQRDLGAYNRLPVKLYYHLDQSYETEAGGTPENIRRKAYNAMLMGAAGSSFNAGPNWWQFFNWRGNMNTPGTVETGHWYNLFRSRRWQDLIPDQHHASVISGLGTWGSTDYVCAARTLGRQTVIAYLPTSRTVGVNMAALSGSAARAWWHNPSTGLASSIGTFPTQGTRAFTPPASGSWVLVIDDASLSLPAPGAAPLDDTCVPAAVPLPRGARLLLAVLLLGAGFMLVARSRSRRSPAPGPRFGCSIRA